MANLKRALEDAFHAHEWHRSLLKKARRAHLEATAKDQLVRELTQKASRNRSRAKTATRSRRAA